MSEGTILPVRSNADASAVHAMPFSRRLSTRLLLLTVLFVLLAEVMVFPPSVANFRLKFLSQKLETAAAISLLLTETEHAPVDEKVQREVLAPIGAMAVAVRTGDQTRLLLATDVPPEIDETIDLDHISAIEAIRGAFRTMFFDGDKVLRVTGSLTENRSEFELILRDTDLRADMLIYARNIAILSLLISMFTASLVFFAILHMLVRPIDRLRRSMILFARLPNDPDSLIIPSDRRDELGFAQQEMAAMQSKIQATLGEQKRLADLGLAVSKINHDMRNILASAQLMSDRLSSLADPSVQSFAPKLIRTLDRAVAYSEHVLAYGRAQEPPPTRSILSLHQVINDVIDMQGLSSNAQIEVRNNVNPTLNIDADPEHLFRILTNLSRNAVQAMSMDQDQQGISRLTFDAARLGPVCRFTVTDTGPGLPERARLNLFAAFRGSARSGGTGLGLAIAQELARAHGGSVQLVESRGGLTTFAVTIPDRTVVPVGTPRKPEKAPKSEMEKH